MALPPPIMTDSHYKDRLYALDSPDKIPGHWKGTPFEGLINSHNFGMGIESTGKPQLLIATCIEFRYALPVPRMHAYVIRRASGRLIGSEFSVAYAIAKGVRHLALIGHNDCGMTQVQPNRGAMINALVEEGWHPDRAEEFFEYHAGRYSISDELASLEREYIRLKRLFRRMKIAPLFYSLADNKLFVPQWYIDLRAKGGLDFGDTVADEELLSVT
ncbi:MAG: hypothetical protein K2Y22_16080 [Candidatus Obscuribacterales bacterium]|nr:hypothetical protein [Candidatus Obscuribacterales bacterium]